MVAIKIHLISLVLVAIFCATVIGGDSTISRSKREPGRSKGRTQQQRQPYGQVMSAPKTPMQSQQSYGQPSGGGARPTMQMSSYGGSAQAQGSQQHHMSAPKASPSQGSYGSMASSMSQPKPRPSPMSSHGGGMNTPKQPNAPSPPRAPQPSQSSYNTMG